MYKWWKNREISPLRALQQPLVLPYNKSFHLSNLNLKNYTEHLYKVSSVYLDVT